MKKSVKFSSILVGFAVCTLSFSGCTKPPAPTNVDIVKAVIQHEQGGTCVVFIPSISIVDKGKRKDDGSIPYHLHYKCLGKPATPKNGTQNNERDITLDMYPTKDSTGAAVWLSR